MLPSILEPCLSHKGALTKNFCHTQRNLAVKGGGGLGGESVNKEKFMVKIFFQIRLNEVLKICKK